MSAGFLINAQMKADTKLTVVMYSNLVDQCRTHAGLEKTLNLRHEHLNRVLAIKTGN